jgi:hypothetical protein
MNKEEPIELELEYVHQTDLAVLVKDLDDNEVWLPKGQIEERHDIDWESLEKEDTIEVTIPTWLAESAGLV